MKNRRFLFCCFFAMLLLQSTVIQADDTIRDTYFPAVVFKGKVVHVLGSMFGYVNPKKDDAFELRFDQIEKTTGKLSFPEQRYIPLPQAFKITDMDSFKVLESTARNTSRAQGYQWHSLRAVAEKGKHKVTLDLNARPGFGHEDFVVAWILIENRGRIEGIVQLHGRIHKVD